jgi:flagellar basal-body rod protein FlgB
MTHQLEALTTASLSLALEAAGRRHQAIAANLANAQAQGYMPVRLAFEAQLADARQLLRERGSVDAQSLAGVRMELEPDVDALGRPVPVQLDAAMVEMARNAVHYQALTQGLSRHLAIQAIAVADGRK